ncbi:unnamed protein product [Rotaria socialis]
MYLLKSRKKYQHKLFQRQSLFFRFQSKRRLKSDFGFHEIRTKQIHSRSFFSKVHRAYRSICLFTDGYKWSDQYVQLFI